MIELAIKRHHFAADRFQHLRRKGARSAIAAGHNDLQLALQLRTVGEIGEIACREILHEMVGAAAFEIEARVEHYLAQPPHLVGPKSERTVGAHFHAGPAIVIV